MKISYHWPRSAVTFTGIILLTQVVTEVIGQRKPGFEWVMPVCGAAFTAAVLWVIAVLVINAHMSWIEQQRKDLK